MNTTADEIRAYATLAAVAASAFWFKWEAIKSARQRDQTNKKVEEVHQLVNSAMTEQKRLTWMFAQQVADDKNDPKAVALAADAKAVYEAALKNAQENAALYRK